MRDLGDNALDVTFLTRLQGVILIPLPIPSLGPRVDFIFYSSENQNHGHLPCGRMAPDGRAVNPLSEEQGKSH